MNFFTVLLLLILAGCSNLTTGNSIPTEKEDYYVILSSLLKVNDDRFTYIDAEGKTQKDKLKAFQQLEKIYIRYVEDPESKEYTQEQLKIIMFFAFYASEVNSGAFREYLAADLNPIYSANTPLFLEIMAEQSFLIEPVCDRLNAFFGFEGKNASSKADFLENNTVLFKEYFSKNQTEACLAQFQ